MLEFIESTHQYVYEGLLVPSVSRLMHPISVLKYEGIPKNILKKAAERGTAVHKSIEDFEQGQEPILNPETQLFFDNYMLFKSKYGITDIQNEVMLGCKDYAGTIDILAKLNGEDVLIDIKCTAKINTGLLAIQLAFYNMLLPKKRRAFVLHITKEKYTFKEIECNYEIAKALLSIYKYGEENVK